MKTDQNDLYSARELVQARPVYNAQSGEARKFIIANRWVKYYSLSWLNADVQSGNLPSRQFLLWYFPGLKTFITNLGQIINPILFQAQWQLMKNHINQENVSLNSAYFHPLLRSPLIQQEYERIKFALIKMFYA